MNILKKKYLLLPVLFVVSSFVFYAFQQKESEPITGLTSEQQTQVDEYIQKRLDAIKRREYWNCQERALKEAIPLADSMIAEMYARDLRASDVILERPKRPKKPVVEIEPFPFDSIE